MKYIFVRPQKLTSIGIDPSHDFSLELLVRSLVITLGIFSGLTIPASAQIIYEGGKAATQAGNTIDIPISEGKPTPTGANLFHSFDKFNVNAGQTANFISTPGIQNILGRVNGANGGSLIDGKLQVTGSNANLFLMNPAGIVFGKGASLDINGAFTATTAKAIDFGNGNWFNAVGANTYGNLNGNPLGLAFTGGTPGSIFNAATLSNVQPGKSITLVGGTVIGTGDIKTAGGNISIATVEGGKYVQIKADGSLLRLDLPASANSIAKEATAFTPLKLAELLTNTKVDLAATGVKNENGVVTLTGNPAAVNALIPDLDKAIAANIKAQADYEKVKADGAKAIADYNKAYNAVGDITKIDRVITNAKDNAESANLNSFNALVNSQTSIDNINKKIDAVTAVGDPKKIDAAIALGDTVSKQNRSISSGDVITRNLDASSVGDTGGNIYIDSAKAILTQGVSTLANVDNISNIDVSIRRNAGSIVLKAKSVIKTEGINSLTPPPPSPSDPKNPLNISLSARGGNVELSSQEGDIIVDWIQSQVKNAQFDTSGKSLAGGDLLVRSAGLFRAIKPYKVGRDSDANISINTAPLGAIDIKYRGSSFITGVTFSKQETGSFITVTPKPGFTFPNGVSGSRGAVSSSVQTNGSVGVVYTDGGFVSIDGGNRSLDKFSIKGTTDGQPTNPDRQASKPKSKENCTPISTAVASNPTAAPTRSAGNPNAVSADPCQPNTSSNGILQILSDRQ
jgi:filamentous hemagglutinin family protein